MNARIGELAFQGGKARAAALSPRRRREIAKRAARARWTRAAVGRWALKKGRQDWGTPQALYDEMNREFGFTLDAAGSAVNAKCARYFDEQADGLAQPWAPETVWCNPPYAATRRWVEKAWRESLLGATVVMLIPVTTDARWWDIAEQHADIRFLRGRVRFVLPDRPKAGSANFASAILVFRPPAAERQGAA